MLSLKVLAFFTWLRFFIIAFRKKAINPYFDFLGRVVYMLLGEPDFCHCYIYLHFCKGSVFLMMIKLFLRVAFIIFD